MLSNFQCIVRFEKNEQHKMKQLFAVDLVLVPDKIIQSKVISLNRSLSHRMVGGIDFSDGEVPHISVWMGLIDESQLDGLKHFIRSQGPVSIQLSEAHSFETKNDCFLAHWNLDEQVEKEIKAVYQSFDRPWEDQTKQLAAQEHFAEKCSKSTIHYVRDFNLKKTRMHITVGHGKLDEHDFKLSGKATWALFHLTDHCTCKSTFQLI